MILLFNIQMSFSLTYQFVKWGRKWALCPLWWLVIRAWFIFWRLCVKDDGCTSTPISLMILECQRNRKWVKALSLSCAVPLFKLCFTFLFFFGKKNKPEWCYRLIAYGSCLMSWIFTEIEDTHKENVWKIEMTRLLRYLYHRYVFRKLIMLGWNEDFINVQNRCWRCKDCQLLSYLLILKFVHVQAKSYRRCNWCRYSTTGVNINVGCLLCWRQSGSWWIGKWGFP